MTAGSDTSDAAGALRDQVNRSASGGKRLKLRTLLAKFGYSKRSDSNTAEITRLLSEVGLALNPPIVRLGESWEMTFDDWIYLSSQDAVTSMANPASPAPAPVWKSDAWFESLAGFNPRTEKEVEIKFIVPLLTRLGYSDDDRFDGMRVRAKHGSRYTPLVLDFALFNAALEPPLCKQPLLTVEAKLERLTDQHELENAHDQAKSYCFWTRCEFYMVTDGYAVHAYQISRGRFGELSPIFECPRHELLARFADLYAKVSKETLTRHYLPKLTTTDETG